jgi:hypothetical protein
MPYFGGLGAGKGWYKFQFAVTPNEMSDVLRSQNPFVVNTNTRVPIDYSYTPLDEYLNSYQQYVDAMVNTVEVPWQFCSSISRGLATSLTVFESKACPDPAYKLMNPVEPVINLGPVPISYFNKKLSSKVVSEICFGIEMTFPRVVSFDKDGYEALYPTDSFETYKLFTELCSLITKMTKRCVFRSRLQQHRTKIRISHEMAVYMKKHAGLISLGLFVK